MKTIKRIAFFAKSYTYCLVLALIFALVSTTFSLLVPMIIGQSIDLIVGEGNVDFKGLTNKLIFLIATVAISVIFQWLMGIFTNKLAFGTAKELRVALFKKLNSVSVGYIDSKKKGDLISRVINDIEVVSDGLYQFMTQLFPGVITIVGTLCFMLTIDVKITLIVVLLTPVSLFLAAFISKKSHSSFSKQAISRGEIGALCEELITGQNEVKAFCYEEKAEERFEKYNLELKKNSQRAVFLSSISNPGTRFVNGLIYGAVGVFGAIAAINGSISVGNLASFLTFSSQYTKPFNEISGVVTELQNALASVSRVFNILDAENESSDEKLAEFSNTSGEIELSNVCFSYNPEVKLIENFNLKVKSGQRVAIVGPTGCGKTTVINLLLKFYDINSGEIRLGGTNVDEITRESLRKSFGMVLQETWIFTGTVADNIMYGKPNATREEVIEVAKAVHAHKFIMKMPNGYDTIISDDGSSVSQGQKQLLCIARVMLANPPMLILDEATSNIDIRTELYVQRAFEKIMRGKTSFIIAHRLSTIKNVDIILVMKNGNIIEQGNHDELIAVNGFYAKLFKSQFEM